MTWFTLIGFESIGEIHSLKVMGNSSVDSKDLFPLNHDFVDMKHIIVVWTGVKNAYITGMFCSDACPDTILVLL